MELASSLVRMPVSGKKKEENLSSRKLHLSLVAVFILKI